MPLLALVSSQLASRRASETVTRVEEQRSRRASVDAQLASPLLREDSRTGGWPTQRGLEDDTRDALRSLPTLHAVQGPFPLPSSVATVHLQATGRPTLAASGPTSTKGCRTNRRRRVGACEADRIVDRQPVWWL